MGNEVIGYYIDKGESPSPYTVFVAIKGESGELVSYSPIGQHSSTSKEYINECQAISKKSYGLTSKGFYTPEEYMKDVFTIRFPVKRKCGCREEISLTFNDKGDDEIYYMVSNGKRYLNADDIRKEYSDNQCQKCQAIDDKYGCVAKGNSCKDGESGVYWWLFKDSTAYKSHRYLDRIGVEVEGHHIHSQYDCTGRTFSYPVDVKFGWNGQILIKQGWGIDC